MLAQLVNHNSDIKRLLEKGFALAQDGGFLVIRNIPYLDSQQQLQVGAVVTKLEYIDEFRVKQENHQVFFAGSSPYYADGTPILNIGDSSANLALSEASKDVVVQRSFSNKRMLPSGEFREYIDFFEKINSYVDIISSPAIDLHNANPYTFRSIETVPNSVFKFHDTLTSRAEITDLVAKFSDDVVAIIGLGGTGAYLLDFLVKTPVREIRAFDRDKYHVHNAFRSPGRLEKSELDQSKAQVYHSRYDNFRHGLSIAPKNIDATCHADLEGVTFAFVCVDKGSARSEIFDLLIGMDIPFIDVGMGLIRLGSPLAGNLQTTYYSVENAEQVRGFGYAQTADDPNEEYKVNVQISELNALNACIAIMKFKQLRGFYAEQNPNYNLQFNIRNLKHIGEWEF